MRWGIFLLFLIHTKIFSMPEFYDPGKEFVKTNFRLGVYQTYSETVFKFKKIEYQEISIDHEIDDDYRYIGKYFSEISLQFPVKIVSNITSCSLTLKPFDRLYYTLKTGVVSFQQLTLEEGKQKFDSIDYGWTGSLGISYTYFPETIVSPSVIFGGGVSVTNFKFNYLVEGSSVSKISAETTLVDPYISFVSTKKVLKILDTYFGGKIIFRKTSLIDRNYYYKLSGEEIVVNLNLGGRIFLSDKESINFEIAYLPEKSYSISLGIMIGY